ncbi:serine/threonine-protein kinase [Lentisphaera marina]|uniref:serine/threonine protein kinase n=1 Tax=Lentisphaera marina TaxID=1111041 RepID=UPI002365FADC|nr:serine/threonine-protein kinase [Lentisphaera marina]MDD7985367.1 serine/threonine-protein kinase [Lentisphaera marina]
MDLSHKLKSLDELEDEFSDQLDLQNLYNFSELNDEELSEITPLLNSIKAKRQRYGEVLATKSGGEKRIEKVYDYLTGREVAMATPLKSKTEIDYEDFLREARITSRLQHPNIMSIHDIGIDDLGQPFFTMDYISGHNLGEFIRVSETEFEHNLNDLLNIFNKVCDAIAYAHSRDVIHLDLKPENINVGRFGEVILYDWGLAKVLSKPEKLSDCDEEIEDLDILNDVTLSGHIKGTPGFLAPEQIGNDSEKNQLSDIYALGAILYYILTQKPPVLAQNLEELIAKTKQGVILSPEALAPDKLIPASLSAVCLKALSLRPEDRYQSVEELQDEIEKYLHGYATEAQHASTWTQIQLLIKRHQTTVVLVIVFFSLMTLFAIYSFTRISKEKNQAITAQHQAEENFRLYKTENELKQKLDRDLRSLVHQSSLGGHYETTRIMIESLDKALADPNTKLDKNDLLSFKGDLHFTLQEFKQAAAAYSDLDKELYEIALAYGEIKPDDKALLSNRQLGDLMESFTSTQYKHVAYQTFYYHVLQSKDKSPQSYIKAVKNILDLLNNVAHWTYEGFSLDPKNPSHLSLRGAPYQIFILPISTEKPFNVLSPLEIGSLDLRNSRTDDLERLLGLKLHTIDVRWTKIRFEKIRLLMKKIGLQKIIITPGQFEEAKIKQLRKSIEFEERLSPVN